MYVRVPTISYTRGYVTVTVVLNFNVVDKRVPEGWQSLRDRCPTPLSRKRAFLPFCARKHPNISRPRFFSTVLTNSSLTFTFQMKISDSKTISISSFFLRVVHLRRKWHYFNNTHFPNFFYFLLCILPPDASKICPFIEFRPQFAHLVSSFLTFAIIRYYDILWRKARFCLSDYWNLHR